MICLAALLAAAPPATRPSSPDDAAVRTSARTMVDPKSGTDAAVADAMVIESDLERRFAIAMVSSYRAELDLFRRAAVATTGSDQSMTAKAFAQPLQMQLTGIAAGTVAVTGDTATLTYDSAPGHPTTFTFRRAAGQWKCDFLRKYRDRHQIDEAHVAILNQRVRAAETTARLYESKEATDIGDLQTLYETMCHTEADAGVARPK